MSWGNHDTDAIRNKVGASRIKESEESKNHKSKAENLSISPVTERLADWNLPSSKPERVKEDWCAEETAQEVLVQYIRYNRYEMCVGWVEDGKWCSNEGVIEYEVVAWEKLPKPFDAR